MQAFRNDAYLYLKKLCASVSLCAEIKNIISTCLLTIGLVAILGVVCITTPELPPGETSGQLLWLSRGCIVFGICGLLSVILRTPSSNYKYPNFAALVSWILICLGGIQAIWGLQQIYGFARSNHSLFSLTGSFFNPGPYSGYLAMILPIVLYEWLRLSKKPIRSIIEHIGYYLSLMVMLLIICVLPAGMSRSAWIAALISCGFVLAIHYSWNKKMKDAWNKNKKKMIALFATSLLVVILGISILFYIKRDSASGRLFMWKISITAIVNNPLGYGTGSFPAVYGDAQEAYFAKGTYTEREELVAGSPEYAFNEYLHIALEWGVPALLGLLLLTAFCVFISIKQQRIGISASLLSLLIFAFSSYPFQLPVFVSTFFFLLVAGVINNRRIWLGAFSLLVGLTGFCFLKTSVYEECVRWRNSRMLYQTGAYEVAVKGYGVLYPSLKEHPAFLFEYGHAYHKKGDWTESTNILLEASKHSCDPMIFNVIGKNCQELGQYEESEKWLLRSTHRLPGRIYPYYLLAKLYAEPAFYQEDKLKEMVNFVLTKKPKVQSTAVRQMREEVKKLIQN